MKQKYGKIYLLLISIAFLLYGNTIKNEYALDDEFVVGQNSITNKGIKAIPKILTSYHAKDESGNEYEYRPMVKISYALEVQFFGNNVHTHHFFNVIYYALCLILLFRMLLLLFENYSLQTILWIVIVFAFIPLHSEVVASLKNRDVLLSFIFSMLTLIVFLKWLRYQRFYYLPILALLFLLALASKFDALPLLAVVPLIYIQKRSSNNIFSNKKIWINVLMIIITLLIAFILLKKGQKILLDQSLKQRVFNYFENPLYFEKEWKYRIIAMFNTLGFYIWMLLVPLKMACYYGYNVILVKSIDAWGIIGVLSFILLAYFFFKKYKEKDLLWYGVVFFSLHISMFLNFVKPVPGIVADRFAFAPSFGWSMMLVYLVEWINQKFILKKKIFSFSNIEWWMQTRIKFYVLFYLLICTILIWYRNYEWRYKLYLYEADVKKYPESVKLHILYGSQIIIEYMQNSGKLPLSERDRYLQIAFDEFHKGLAIDSSCASCLNNIAFLYMNWKKDYATSIPYLLKSYRLDSTRKELLNNIAIAYFKTGRNKDTIELFLRKSLKYDKDKTYEIPFDVMREYCKQEKKYQKGIDFIQQYLSERPNSVFLYYALGELQIYNGDTADAIQSYEKLLQLNPNYPQVAKLLKELRERDKDK
ncbi:MAG: hypothetical protein KatS3mg027_2209 [Bacteroidia bacterium]|nr:MAG: hypothetical protein KatS3mg027_2209 [Bacteroidia bacterium]